VKNPADMISLQRLLGKDERFFDLLEASAQQAHQSVGALIELLRAPDGRQKLDELIHRRRREKEITEEITTRLCNTFITPLEREDIESLSTALYKIPKTIEKFSERMLVAREKLQSSDFADQIRLLESATGILERMVGLLRQRPRIESVRELNEQLQHCEGEADKLMVDLLRDLYSGRHDPLRVIILRNLYELLEKVIDRCRDAGNIVFHIVLKYS